MNRSFEDEVRSLALEIAELGADQKASVYRMSWWSERMLAWSMARPEFKTELFRFVDVFPSMEGTGDVVRHMREYFEGEGVPRILDLGVHFAEHAPFGKPVAAGIARRNITRMAQQFIVGTDAADSVAGLKDLWDSGSAFTVDLLGEKTVTAAEADRYAARVDTLVATLLDATEHWPENPTLETDDLGTLPRASVSVKPTALSPHYAPLTRDRGIAEVKRRLMPVLRVAAERGAYVWIDMEHYDVKDLTLALFREILTEPGLEGLQAGVVIQAYLRDSRDDLADLISWARQARVRPGVRLVKGAYWDSETIQARANGWPVPVFERKQESDANYERCTRLLHDHHDAVRAAFASHNLRSLAYAVTYAREKGIPDNGYEIQMLYGMAEPIHAAIRKLGLRLRVYAPVGELVPGMAYLVRRLLENTSNDSFVRLRFAEGRELERLIEAPDVDTLPGSTVSEPVPPTDPDAPSEYEPEPLAEWRRTSTRAAFSAAVRDIGGKPAMEIPAVIAGERLMTTRTIDSVDPAEPSRVVARSAATSAPEVTRALDAAEDALEGWRTTTGRQRAAVLFKAAAWLRERRYDIAALEVFEAGKPWAEADADVCEAIDFCEYYGRQMIRLSRGGEVQSPPGEVNTMTYQARGIGVVIAPWNFPLAIPMGMVAAGIVAGNPVILKPAEQTPATAFKIVEAFGAAGLPDGVFALLPGFGEDVGVRLVEDPRVAFISFTGSMEVGLSINENAAKHRPGQAHVKRVIAEMGGKNALIVDSDADLDQAVPAIVQSAFGFSGQKCSALSRLIVLDSIHDELLDRLRGAVEELSIGSPSDMSTQVGPLIDSDAQDRLIGAINDAPNQGTVIAQRQVSSTGFFVGPTVVSVGSPDQSLVRDEFFGPLLTVLKARDFDDAVRLANDTDYALTAGVISRSPENIRRAGAELKAGNVYVNRGITGAVVGRQPFGGYGLSGVGSKAGGPDYLLQFLEPKVVTENTLRQGFAPGMPGDDPRGR